MIRKFNTNGEQSSTQRLDDLLIDLRKLREKLENTEEENESLIQYAYDNHLISIFNNDVEIIQKHLKRLYYGKR
jgi:hypothetical protein